jgi:hypothetical protein
MKIFIPAEQVSIFQVFKGKLALWSYCKLHTLCSGEKDGKVIMNAE